MSVIRCGRRVLFFLTLSLILVFMVSSEKGLSFPREDKDLIDDEEKMTDEYIGVCYRSDMELCHLEDQN